MVPPEFGPRIGPHSNPVTAGGTGGGIASPRLTGAFPPLPPEPCTVRLLSLGGEVGYSSRSQPVSSGVFYHLLRLRQGVGEGFSAGVGRGGFGPAQVSTCGVVSRPVRAGIQAFSRESPDAKSRGGGPRPLSFRGRSFPLARFGVVGRIGAVDGLLRGPCSVP